MSRPNGQSRQPGKRAPAARGPLDQDPLSGLASIRQTRAPSAPQQPAAPQLDPYGHQSQGYYYQQSPAMPAAPQQSFPGQPPGQYQEPQFAPAHQYTYAAPQQAYAPQPPAPGYPQVPQPGFDPRTYDWSQPTAEPALDPHAFNLNAFGYQQAPQAPEPAPAPYHPQHAPAEAADWNQAAYQNYYGDAAYGQPQPAEPRLDPSGYGNQYAGQDAYGQVQGGEFEQGYGEDGELEYDEEPPARSRLLIKVAAAVAGLVIVGGGLTFAYQQMGGAAPDGPTPVVAGQQGPARVRPTDPGGKQFAHSDSKITGRLGDTASGASDDPNSPRKVSTLVVGRDGSIQAPPATQVPPPSGVPGLTLVDVTGGASAASPPPSVVATTQPAPPANEPPRQIVTANAKPAAAPVAPARVQQSAAPPVKPVVVARATPTPAAPSAPVTTTQAISKSDATDPASSEPKKTTIKKAAIAPQPAPTGAGYVAVLASVPASGSSRLDALKQFADMQQRYGETLQNKTPDVQEANLGEKGTYHRLVVGPPGSRDSANTVCSQLKTQGYGDCWVMAY